MACSPSVCTETYNPSELVVKGYVGLERTLKTPINVKRLVAESWMAFSQKMIAVQTELIIRMRPVG
jgi:hypothetical protein